MPEKPWGDPPKPLAKLDAHTNVISRLVATPDGKTLISSSYDHTIRYWTIPAKLPEPTEPLLLNARTIEDTTRRKSNGAKVPPPNEAKVGVLKPAHTLEEHKEWVVGMSLSPDGKALITGDDGGHIIVWEVPSAKPGGVARGDVKKRWKLAKGWAYAVALSPDAKQACVTERLPLVFDSGRHAAVKLWNTSTAEVTKDLSAEKEFKGHHMSAAAYSPDGKQLAVLRGGESGGLSGKPVLVDPATGKIVKELGPQGHLVGGTDLAWHPDSKHLASAGRDTTVRVWEVPSAKPEGVTATGKLVSEVGKGRGGQFKDWICAVSWSADGKWLASADMAGAVQIWTFPG